MRVAVTRMTVAAVVAAAVAAGAGPAYAAGPGGVAAARSRPGLALEMVADARTAHRLAGATLSDPQTTKDQGAALGDALARVDAAFAAYGASRLTGDQQANTVSEEEVRTSYWTLVDLVLDLQSSWSSRRGIGFSPGTGAGFLGTCLLAAGIRPECEMVADVSAAHALATVAIDNRQTPDKERLAVSAALSRVENAFITYSANVTSGDEKVNTANEEQVRTEYWTLVGLVLDLRASWTTRRAGLGSAGAAFLATCLFTAPTPSECAALRP